MSDFDLVGGGVIPLASGRPVRIGTMNGRDRAYAFASANTLGKSALSVVFNDRCDMVVATASAAPDKAASTKWRFTGKRLLERFSSLPGMPAP